VDKTGTLTEGKPRVVAVVAEWNEGEVIRYAASLETASEHPLAAAVVGGARGRGLEIPKARGFRSLAGKGGTGAVEGDVVGWGSGRSDCRQWRTGQKRCGATARPLSLWASTGAWRAFWESPIRLSHPLRTRSDFCIATESAWSW